MKKVALLVFVLLAALTLAPTVASASLDIAWTAGAYKISVDSAAVNDTSGEGWKLEGDTLTLSDEYANGGISITPKTDALFTLAYKGAVTVDGTIFFVTSPTSGGDDFSGVETAITGEENGTLTVKESTTAFHHIGQAGGKMTIGGSGTVIAPQIINYTDPEIVIQDSVSLKITLTSTEEPVFGIFSGNADKRYPPSGSDQEDDPAAPLTYGPLTISTTGTVEVTSPAFALIGSPITINSGTVKLTVNDAQKAYDANGAAPVVNGGELYVNGTLVPGGGQTPPPGAAGYGSQDTGVVPADPDVENVKIAPGSTGEAVVADHPELSGLAAVTDGGKAKVSEITDKATGIDAATVIGLPVMETPVTGGKTALINYSLTLNGIAEKNYSIQNLRMVKLAKDGSALGFERTADPKDVTDGKFAVVKTSALTAALDPSDLVEMDVSYTFFFGIADNGKYDWDGTAANIVDPAGIGAGSDRSSGGCSVSGLGLGALTLAALALLKRRG